MWVANVLVCCPQPDWDWTDGGPQINHHGEEHLLHLFLISMGTVAKVFCLNCLDPLLEVLFVDCLITVFEWHWDCEVLEGLTDRLGHEDLEDECKVDLRHQTVLCRCSGHFIQGKEEAAALGTHLGEAWTKTRQQGPNNMKSSNTM
jgi:hypothetical protein